MKFHRRFSACALLLFACSQQATPPAETAQSAAAATSPEASAKLDAVLAAQPADAQSRYAFRHPKETLEFFGVAPGMTVVDTLPGPVWYTGILLDYLGPTGKVIDADYSAEMWTKFGDYSPDPKTKENWSAETVAKMTAARGADDAQVGAFQYGSVPDDMAGSADVVLMVRAIHHFMRLEDNGAYLSQALADVKKVLKPGGLLVIESFASDRSSPQRRPVDIDPVRLKGSLSAFDVLRFDDGQAMSEWDPQPTRLCRVIARKR